VKQCVFGQAQSALSRVMRSLTIKGGGGGGRGAQLGTNLHNTSEVSLSQVKTSPSGAHFQEAFSQGWGKTQGAIGKDVLHYMFGAKKSSHTRD
jgi:hypothetical protein